MGVAEKVLLASLKAQRSQVAKQAERSGLDAQTRALMQENLAYLQAQIDVLEAGGTTADLEGIPQPASWDSDDQDAPTAVSARDASASPYFEWYRTSMAAIWYSTAGTGEWIY